MLNKISGTYEVSDSTKEVSHLKLANDLHSISGETGILSWFKHIFSIIELIFSGDALGTVTRAEAALEIYKVKG